MKLLASPCIRHGLPTLSCRHAAAETRRTFDIMVTPRSNAFWDVCGLQPRITRLYITYGLVRMARP